MDAFAVALCCGMVNHEKAFKSALLIALFFGGFQALMPLTGWGILYPFADYFKSIGPYVMLVLLNGIGAYMIYEAFSGGEDDERVELTTVELVLWEVATCQEGGQASAQTQQEVEEEGEAIDD